jgi:anti-sigma B factor antagonist
VSQKSAILAGLYDHSVWLRVSGKGTFQISAGMKEYSRRMIRRGHRAIVVDLADCELMDSTFMGTMAGIALRLREMGSGSLTVLNSNKRNLSLLENLGLDHLFLFALPEGAKQAPRQAAAETLPPATPDATAQQEVIRDAHIALVVADPENEEKFKDVLELLEQELSQDAGDS